MHDCSGEIPRSSSKGRFSDKLYNAEQVGKYIDPDVTEYIFENKSEVIHWRMQGKIRTTQPHC